MLCHTVITDNGNCYIFITKLDQDFTITSGDSTHIQLWYS